MVLRVPSIHRFHIHVTGYAYHKSHIIDVIFAGYNYRIAPSLRRVVIEQSHGSHALETLAYHGSDDHLYLRFRMESTYYTTFRADSMYVGNGYILKRGDIQVHKTDTAEL